jgi:hypothetical protein
MLSRASGSAQIQVWSVAFELGGLRSNAAGDATMKTVLLTLATIGLFATSADDAAAHGRYYRGHRHISFGIGYGFHYPHRYYYPSSYIGVGIWPRSTVRRTRADHKRGDIRTKELYVYPAAGQTAEQTADDRYECHVWAADQSDYDPTLGAGSRADADAYGRAFSACMEGRDYVVK